MSRRQRIAREIGPEQLDERAIIDLGRVRTDNAGEDRLLHLSSLLWMERRRVLRFAVVAAVLTLIIALLMPDIYQSTTRVMPPEKSSPSGMAAIAGMAAMAGKSSSSGGTDLGMLASDFLGMQSTGALFMGIVKSRTAQEALVDKFDLTTEYGLPWLRIKASRENARKELERNTEVSEDRKSGIITVSITDKDPKRAAAMAAGYIDELNRLVSSLSTSAAGRERQFLEEELVKVKKDLDQADQQLSQFSSKNATFDPREQGKAMVQAAAELQGELIAAESQLRGLESIYTENNVRVRTLRARISELRKQLNGMSGNGDSSEYSPSGDSDSPFPSIRQLPLLGYTYADLFRRAKIEEAVYQVLTQQYEAAKVQEAKEIPTVRTLDVADVPEKKFGPHRGVLAIVGAFFGLLIGSAWIIAMDRWRNRDNDDGYKLLVSDVVGTVQSNRVWRHSEAGVKRVIAFSRDRVPRWHKNGSSNGSGDSHPNGNSGGSSNPD